MTMPNAKSKDAGFDYHVTKPVGKAAFFASCWRNGRDFDRSPALLVRESLSAEPIALDRSSGNPRNLPTYSPPDTAPCSSFGRPMRPLGEFSPNRFSAESRKIDAGEIKSKPSIYWLLPRYARCGANCRNIQSPTGACMQAMREAINGEFVGN